MLNKAMNVRVFAVMAAALSVFGVAGAIQAVANETPPQEKRFYYQIRLPQTDRSCNEEATRLGERFAALTGLKVSASHCRGVQHLKNGEETYSVYSVILTYLSKQEVFSYSAFFGTDYMDVPRDGSGVYSTYASCMAELEQQASLYEKNTGLRVLAATCQEGSYSYDKGVVLRIDGLGQDLKSEPKLRLYAFNPRIRGQLEVGMEESIEALVAKLGGNVVSRRKNTVFYYSQYPVPVRYQYLGEFILADECHSQLEEIRSIFSKLGSHSVIAHCLKSKDPKHVGSAILELVRDRAAGDPSYVTRSSQFYSLSECMEDRARALDEEASRGYVPLGAICRKTWSDRYEMELYSRYRY